MASDYSEYRVYCVGGFTLNERDGETLASKVTTNQLLMEERVWFESIDVIEYSLQQRLG
jgi:hypothetical protein